MIEWPTCRTCNVEIATDAYDYCSIYCSINRPIIADLNELYKLKDDNKKLFGMMSRLGKP